jgi:cytosine/adenosine deaminase-related metal-dependent hydrolase
MICVSVERAWLPQGEVRDICLQLDEQGQILELRSWRAADPPPQQGLLLPGLINAHCHLELPGPAVQGGQGLLPWVLALYAAGRRGELAQIQASLEAAHAAGAIGLIDISNGLLSLGASPPPGFALGVQHEVLGFGEGALAVLSTELPPAPALVGLRRGPHAPVSTGPALLRATLGAPARSGGMLPTMHCDEDSDSAPFLASGTGPWADFLDQLGRPWRGQHPRCGSGVELLHKLKLLGPELGLVHLCHLPDPHLPLLQLSGATAVLCPRSNLHIGGRLPSPALLRADLPLAIGTDSLCSTPDLDLLAEAAELARACPDLPAERWLRALTEGGARLLGQPQLGRIALGARPGLLLVELPAHLPLSALFHGERWPRRWLHGGP